MSTCSVYGARDGELDESSPTNPLSAYAVTKLAAESYLKDKNAMIFRLGTLFGLGDNYSRIRLDLVVNTMTVRAITEGKLRVFGGEQYRPLLHVKDAAQVIADNLETKHTGIFNVHKENIRILDLARLVEKSVPGVSLDIVDTSFEDSRNYKATSDKAVKTFGFKPKYDAKQGIKEVKRLIEEGRIKDYNNPRYSNQGYLSMFNTHHLVDEDK
jgi:nucleoside-diphosphate-sugar epimerase